MERSSRRLGALMGLLYVIVFVKVVNGDKICPYAECICHYFTVVDSMAICNNVSEKMPPLQPNYDPVKSLSIIGDLKTLSKEDLPSDLSDLDLTTYDLVEMAEDALENSAHSLKSIYLTLSEEFHFPFALTRLDNLKEMKISDRWNQIYNETILQKIGKTVETMDFRYATSFHGEKLRYFKKLKNLRIGLSKQGMTNMTFDESVFESLETLEISLLYEEEPPKSLRNFKKLKELVLNTFDLSGITNFGVFMQGSRNTITSLEFEDCTMKEYNNDFSGFKNLETFTAVNTNISEIPTFATNSQLRTLSLKKNTIKYVRGSSLEGLDKLISLDLSNNDIGTIQLDSFKGTKSLEFLQLSGNRITTVPPALARSPALLNVNLLDNPIKCPCTPKDLHKWVVKERDFFDNFVLNLPASCVGGFPSVTVEFVLRDEDHVCSDEIF